MSKVQIARWGNSTAVRLPKAVVDRLGLVPGKSLELVVEGRDIRLRAPARTTRDLLEEMVAEAKRLGQTPSETIDWGPDRGTEIIEDDAPTGRIEPGEQKPHDEPR